LGVLLPICLIMHHWTEEPLSLVAGHRQFRLRFFQVRFTFYGHAQVCQQVKTALEIRLILLDPQVVDPEFFQDERIPVHGLQEFSYALATIKDFDPASQKGGEGRVQGFGREDALGQQFLAKKRTNFQSAKLFFYILIVEVVEVSSGTRGQKGRFPFIRFSQQAFSTPVALRTVECFLGMTMMHLVVSAHLVQFRLRRMPPFRGWLSQRRPVILNILSPYPQYTPSFLWNAGD
jgi:hypothetical protein